MARDRATTYACCAFYSLFADSLGIPVDAGCKGGEGRLSSGAFPRISLFLVSSRNDGDREERGRERWQERIAVEEQELDKITFVSLK